MELTLKNFRCYRGEHHFSFLSPLVFLLGVSGAGKSSILDALVFVLTGKGKNCASHVVGAPAAPFSVELSLEGGARLTRAKTSLVYFDGEYVSDVVAQSKIDKQFGRHLFVYSQGNSTHFLELAPREQLELMEEILFGDEVDIKELKGKFNAEKRVLDGVRRELESKERLTREFLAKIGPITEVTHTRVENEREIRHRLCFLQMRLKLRAMYGEKKGQLERELKDFAGRLKAANRAPAVPYSEEQVARHIEAARRLQGIRAADYAEYTAAECEVELEDYRKDEELLRTAEALECPVCHFPCHLKGEKLEAAKDLPDITSLLEELEVESREEALIETRRQIVLYQNYKEKRELLEKYQADILPLADAAAAYRELRARAKVNFEVEMLEAQRAERKGRLEALERAARESGVAEWGAHEVEVKELTGMLENAELHSMREKETAIRREYEAQLAELAKKARMCDARRGGLMRANGLLADTEQQYLGEMIEYFVAEVNQLLEEVFTEGLKIEMAIEAGANGARKLKVVFNNGYVYEMFSGGEKARINLCFLVVFAKVQKYRVLLLDEVTRGLDRETAGTVFEALRRNFAGQIIVAEHERVMEIGEGIQEIEIK